jgi:hypothetical protein
MEWFKFKNGNGIVRVKDIESACNDFTENIIELFNTQKSRNDRLQEENAILKDEHYKDKKIQELEDKISELRSELGYSFRMTKEDWDRVREWQIQHQAEKHGLKTSKDRLAAGGAIGGNWTFEFVPTSIGTVGTCICGSCKEEFVFQELM